MSWRFTRAGQRAGSGAARGLDQSAGPAPERAPEGWVPAVYEGFYEGRPFGRRLGWLRWLDPRLWEDRRDYRLGQWPEEHLALHDLSEWRWLEDEDRADLLAGRLKLPRRCGWLHRAVLVSMPTPLENCRVAWVDAVLAPVVSGLGRAGYVTDECCQGRVEEEPDEDGYHWVVDEGYLVLASRRQARDVLAPLRAADVPVVRDGRAIWFEPDPASVAVLVEVLTRAFPPRGGPAGRPVRPIGPGPFGPGGLNLVGRTGRVVPMTPPAGYACDPMISHRVVVGDLAEGLTSGAGLTTSPPATSVRACRICGCTQDDACWPTCWWVGADLCSACAPTPSRASGVSMVSGAGRWPA